MKAVRVKVDLSQPDTLPKGRIDARVLDAATEQDLALQQAMDDAEAMADAARFARRVRKRQTIGHPLSCPPPRAATL
jgi:putative transcriptional regulator